MNPFGVKPLGREHFFLLGMPVIISFHRELPIGHRFKTMSGGFFLGEYCKDYDQPHEVIRRATFDEYLETVRPEYRQRIIESARPGLFFYEVSTD